MLNKSTFLFFLFFFCWSWVWTQAGRYSTTTAKSPTLVALAIFSDRVLHFCTGLASNYGPATYVSVIVEITGMKHYAQIISCNVVSLLLFFFCPRLVVNHIPLDLHLPSSWDYRWVPWWSVQIFVFVRK
jgi:hypothetical protein